MEGVLAGLPLWGDLARAAYFITLLALRLNRLYMNVAL
jgi:hypothetical protein